MACHDILFYTTGSILLLLAFINGRALRRHYQHTLSKQQLCQQQSLDERPLVPNPPPRHSAPTFPPQQLDQQIDAARSEAVDRGSHFETLLATVGSLQLGIAAYLSKFHSTPHPDHLQRSVLLALLILIAAGIAYLHIWKLYLSYLAYAVYLEILYRPFGILRATSTVFLGAQTPVSRTRSCFFCELSRVSHLTIHAVTIFPATIVVATYFVLYPNTRASFVYFLMAITLALAYVTVSPPLQKFLHLVSVATETP